MNARNRYEPRIDALLEGREKLLVVVGDQEYSDQRVLVEFIEDGLVLDLVGLVENRDEWRLEFLPECLREFIGGRSPVEAGSRLVDPLEQSVKDRRPIRVRPAIDVGRVDVGQFVLEAVTQKPGGCGLPGSGRAIDECAVDAIAVGDDAGLPATVTEHYGEALFKYGYADPDDRDANLEEFLNLELLYPCSDGYVEYRTENDPWRQRRGST